MPKDTITLALNGEVYLHHFTKAVSKLEILVQELSNDLGVAKEIRWVVHDLQVGSAVATIRGESDVLQEVERIVNAYSNVGQALQAGKRPDFSDQVVKAASGITDILDD